MRVLMTSSVEPSLSSGVGSVEYSLISGLRAKGVQVKEYFPRMRSIAVTDFFKGLSLSKHARNCDLIHAHTDISWNTRGALRTFHGVAALGEKFYRQERQHALMPAHKQKAYFIAHKALEAACVLKNKCIAVSEYVKNALMQFYGASEENVATIYNGIDAREFKPDKKAGRAFRAKNNISEDAFLLTWVGHAEFNKGLHYLIELMNIVALDKKMKEVVLAVRSPLDKAQLRFHRMSAKALENTLCIPLQHSLRAFYNASDAHLLTSVYEPFCLTLLEAMACGKPVIATRSGGHEEIITPGAGILLQLRDVKAMKNALAELVEDSGKRKKMGDEARKVILRGFTKEHMVEKTLDYYQQQIE